MPTAGVAATRSRCRWCMRGRAQMPSNLPFRQQALRRARAPDPLCREHGAVISSAAPPSLRGCLSFLEDGGGGPLCLLLLGSPGCADLPDSQECVPGGTRHPARPDFMPEHSDDPGCAALTGYARVLARGYKAPTGAGPCHTPAGRCRSPGGAYRIATGQVPCQLNPAIVDCLRRSGKPRPHLRLPRSMTRDTQVPRCPSLRA